MSKRPTQVHSLILNANGNTIYSTIQAECVSCIRDCLTLSELTESCGSSGKRRRGTIITEIGQVFLCSDKDEDIESSKTFKKELGFLAEMIGQLSEIQKNMAEVEAKKTNRLFHNLTSINGHTIQELYALVPQEELSARFKEQRKIVRQRLEQSPDAAAEAFLRILKNEISLRNEFSAYSKLYDPNPTLRVAKHSLHKVVLNVVNLFFQDFADKLIEITIDPTDARINLDYESIQVALYHLFDNAAKYAEPETEITVKFDFSAIRLRMDIYMSSLYIAPDETTRLFEEGFSGALTRLAENSGKGLGMGLTRELLHLNDAVITVKAGRDEYQSKSKIAPKNVRYATNCFSISFGSEAIAGVANASNRSSVATKLAPNKSRKKLWRI